MKKNKTKRLLAILLLATILTQQSSLKAWAETHIVEEVTALAENTESETTEPTEMKPEAEEPAVTQPETAKPETEEPAVTEPEVKNPEVTKPEEKVSSGTEQEETEDRQVSAEQPEEKNPEQMIKPAAMVLKRADDGSYDMGELIKKAEIKVQINGKWYDVTDLPDNMTVPKNAPVSVKIAYDPIDIQFKPGESLTYQIPEGITIDSVKTGNVMDGPSVAGIYRVDQNGKITITFDEDYLEKHDGYVQNGTINFSGHFNDDAWGNGGDKEIVFGDIKVEIPFTPDQVVTKGNLNITKKVIKGGDHDIKEDDKGKYIEYEITVSAPSDNTMDMKNVTVEDMFTVGGNYIQQQNGHPDIFDVHTNGCGNFIYDNGWKWTGIGDMKAGESHTLTFKVRLNENITSAGADAGDRVITNKAEVKSEGNKKNEASVSAKSNASLNIKKTTDGYDAETGTITYKVVVEAPKNNTWDIENVTVDDIFGTNKEYVESYTTVKPSVGTVDQQYAADKKLIWNIGTMKPGATAELEYTVKVDDKIFLKGKGDQISESIDNTAHLKVNGQEKGKSNAKVNFKKVWIRKNGQLQDNGKIKFTIHANETTTAGGNNSGSNAGATLPPINANITFKDQLTGDWVYDGKVTIQRYTSGPNPLGKKVGEPVTVDVDGKTEWTWTDPNPGAYYYEVEYYARLKEAVIGKPGIGNGAGIGIGVGGDNYDHNTQWNGSGKEYDALTKTYDNMEKTVDGTIIANWTSKITCPVPAGAVYEDYRNSDHAWTFTDEQINTVTVKADNGSRLLTAGTDYVITRTNVDGFRIQFKKDVDASAENPIMISYNCTLKTDDINETETAKYVNKASLTINGHTDSSQAECHYTKEQLIKKTAAEYKNNGELVWNIKVNTTGNMKDEAVVIDELQEGLEYVSAEISERGKKASGTTMEEPVIDGQKVTMKLKGLVESNDKEAYVVIKLVTKIVDEDFLVSNTTQTFSNKATLEYGGVTKESSADQKITNTAISKKGSYDKNTAPDIVYTVNVNPNGVDMLKDGDTIRIQDVMGENMMLHTDSLEVKNANTGAKIDVTESLEIKENVFSFDVPDDQPIVITYRAYVMGEVGETVNVTNTVSYYGEAEAGSVESNNEIIVDESDATIEGKPAFYIHKKDGTDKTTPLSGAEYTLYQFESGNWTEVETQLSNEDGYVYFTDLDADTVYAFCETKAPDGFYIDAENAKKTYIAFNKEAVTDVIKEAVAVDNGSEVKIIQSGITYDRFNYKGEITVKKAFGTDNTYGDLDFGTIPNGNYYFGLFDESHHLVTLAGKPAVENIVVADGKIVDADEDGSGMVTFEGVPVGENGGAKTYYVYETDSDGNKLTGTDGIALINGGRFEVSGEGKVQVSGAKPEASIKITNKEKPLVMSLQASKQLANVASGTNFTFDFGLYDESGELIETKQNDKDGKIAFSEIPFTRKDVGEHRYTIKEIIPNSKIAGITYDVTEYQIVITVEHGLTVSVTANGTALNEEDGVFILPNQQNKEASFVNVFEGSAKLTKVAAGNADANLVLEGAEFALYRVGVDEESGDEESDRVGTYTTNEKGELLAEHLAEGRYYFVETKAPTGYGIKMDENGNPVRYSFEIGPNGGKQVVNYDCKVENEALHFNVNKVDLADHAKEIAGAELTVFGKDADGNEVKIDSWISKEGETHDFGACLEAGKEYILRETAAPDGYAYTCDIVFTVNEDGTITTGMKTTTNETTGEVTYLVEDDVTRLTVMKVDEDGKGVAGARLVLKDTDGHVIKDETGEAKYSWVTTGKPHELGGIPAGDYILSELEAPEGYELAKDVRFTLSDAPDADNKVTMVDRKIPESFKGSITVTKTLKLNNYAADIGVDAATFYVALFSDENRTDRISSVKPIVFEHQTVGTVVFEKLGAGKYYIGETDKFGNLIEKGYVDEVEYRPEYGDGYLVNLESDTYAGQIHFENVFDQAPKGFYYEGTLSVTKEVLRDGKPWNTDNTYYAGVFKDAAHTELLGQMELKMNGKSDATAEMKVPLGEDPDKKISFYVTEVDKNGKPLKNGKNLKFKISVKGSEVVMTGKNPMAKVTITNSYKTWLSKVKTGDHAKVMTWMTLMGAALLAVVLLGCAKKRRKR